MRIAERRCNVPSTYESRCRQSMTPEPLTDSDFESLGNVLKRFGGKAAMNLEQLDGFLAAIICYPSDIPKTEYLPEIWGDEMINEDTFAGQPTLQGFLSLIARHKDAVAHTLQSGDVFTPVLLANTDGVFPGNDWANGFLRGMELRREDWFVLFNNENHGGSLVPIFALAHEHDPDPEMRSYKEPISAEQREKLIVGTAAGVMNIYKYFRTHHIVTETPVVSDSFTYRRFTRKTGRNELCPCGSGKKFKHCCGRVTLH
jgi:uncharacterized protein